MRYNEPWQVEHFTVLSQGGEDFGTALAHTSALCLEVADRIIREL